MRPEITIVYNDPFPGNFKALGEEAAVLGILECVQAVHNALLESGYTVDRVSLFPPIRTVRRQLSKVKTELIFNVFEGFYDDPESEANVARIISEMGYRFTGCPVKALSLALDKAKSKEILAKHGINVARFQILDSNSLDKFNMDFPCIVKPRNQDASHGISQDNVVNDVEQLKKQIDRLSESFNGKVLVEEFLSGREFNICVIGNEEIMALPPSEIIYELPPELPRILTYEAKWITESEYFKATKVVCPAPISEELKNEIINTALEAYRIFECRGYARVDLRQDTNGSLKVMEVNPNPDISPDTGAARQAMAAGMTYAQFIDKIAMFAVERVYV